MGQMYASMDHPIVYCAYSLPRMMPSEYIWVYLGIPMAYGSMYTCMAYIPMGHPMVYGTHSPLPEYSTVVYVHGIPMGHPMVTGVRHI